MSVANFSFDLAPKAAMEYLAAKGQKLTFDYDEMMHEMHHKTFTVAKVTKLDLLADIQESLQKAQAEGIPFEQWKKELKPTLQKAGWWGETSVTNPATGEVRDIYVGSRRLRTIYYTNMRVSQSVGRYREMMELPLSVYWRYVAWKRNYPPNAWNCRCTVQALSRGQIDKNGWKISPEGEPLPDGYDDAALLQRAINYEANEYLKSTDWYTNRYIEKNVAIPDDVKVARDEARARIVH